jgi:hypothetical protein
MKNINKIATQLVLSFAALAITATAALAAPITIPAGLNPGDQYRLAFVTSTFRTATSTDIADYNAFVTAAANSQTELAALGTTWMAIASTATVDARDNTGTNPSSTGFPIFLLDPASTKIADNNADLWDGDLDAALNVTESGTSIAPSRDLVWTGTTSTGEGQPGRVLGSTDPQYGLYFDPSVRWVSSANDPNTFGGRFYGLSGILTVTAVPEPGAMSVLALGLVGFAALRRKRKLSADC